MPSMPDKNNPKYDLPLKELGQGNKPNGLVRIVSNLGQAKVTIKPWGKESIISGNKEYAFKKIEIKQGFETSLQCHSRKNETIFFLSGKARVVFEDEGGSLVYCDMAPGSVFETRAPSVHRVVALTDITYVEASTPDPGDTDVVRLRDGFKRKDGRIEGEHGV